MFMISFALFIFLFNIDFNTLKTGEKLFSTYCIACHAGGSNRIIPEKNLKKETLETLGIDNFDSLIYQITNGKNGMPAFGGRLKQIEIENITFYLLEEKQFQE
jgi:cytochrome c6